MSNRELRALQSDLTGLTGTYFRTRAKTMSQQHVRSEPERNSSPDSLDGQGEDETAALKHKLAKAKRNEALLTLHIEELEKKVELAQMEHELSCLKALDTQRKEFQEQMEMQREELQAERKRADSWMKGVTNLSVSEKQFYNLKIRTLEDEVNRMRQELECRGSVPQRVSQGICVSGANLSGQGVYGEGQHGMLGHDGRLGSMGGRHSSNGDGCGYGVERQSLCNGVSGECMMHGEGMDDQGAVGRQDKDGRMSLGAAEDQVLPSAGGSDLSPGRRGLDPQVIDLERNLASPSSADPLHGFETNPLLIEGMARLLQAQTDMLSAQAQAVAVQGPLP